MAAEEAAAVYAPSSAASTTGYPLGAEPPLLSGELTASEGAAKFNNPFTGTLRTRRPGKLLGAAAMRMTERSDDGLAQVAARGLAKMGRDITGRPLAGADRRAADEEDVKYTRRLDRAYGRRRAAAEAAAAPEENLENADPEEAAAALATSVFLEMASAKSELEKVMAVLDQSGEEVMAVLDQSGEQAAVVAQSYKEPPPPAADDGDGDDDDDDNLADLVPFGILLLRDANSKARHRGRLPKRAAGSAR